MSNIEETPVCYAIEHKRTIWERVTYFYDYYKYKWFPEKSSSEWHAERELALLLKEDPTDEMQIAINKHILKMVREFAKEGHSGFSASYATSILTKLLKHEPILPLTGEDSEWNNVTDSDEDGSTLYQNNRCSRVFKTVSKDGDVYCYDIDGKVFKYPSGACYTSIKSRTEVTFPYHPKTEYVEVEEDDE